MPNSPSRQAQNRAWVRPKSKLWTYGLSLSVSAGLLALLLSQVVDTAGFRAQWARLSPEYAVLGMALFLGNLVLRGLRLRRLAMAAGDSAGRFAWIRLCAVHQILFSVLPSASADIGFPHLAARLLGCPAVTAARVLLVYRLQDLWTLLILFATALFWYGAEGEVHYAVLFLVATTAAALLVWANDLTRFLGAGLLQLIAPSGAAWEFLARPLRRLATELDRPVCWTLRIHGAATALLSWSLAALSIWSFFAMIQVDLGLSETLLVITGMNLVGAVAVFTVAGLGVAEGGLAAILLALGFGASNAVAAALTVRPAALASVVIGGGLIECSYRLFRRFRA